MDIIYKVDWKEYATEDLKRLDHAISNIIHEKVGTHLIKAPNQIGKPLSGDLKGFWSYRIKGVYRACYKIIEDQTTITIFVVGHRRDVYERFKKLLLKLKLKS